MLEHYFTCGCVMVEGHRQSEHPSGDFREKSCPAHTQLPSYVWPHYADDTIRRIPDSVDLLVERIMGDWIADHLDPNIPEDERRELQRKLRNE
jgi:hypothetical protein